ncbi:MAG: 2-C-methyl-D-erythritol 4-phosphate cytidylyltransferase, partial [Victivallaceae bacterium]
ICQKYLPTKPVEIIAGGAERYNSVLNGLQAVENNMEFVAIHDAARPLAQIELIISGLELLQHDKSLHGVSAAHKVVDTIKKVHSTLITDTVPREDLWAMETPQIFRLQSLLRAYRTLPPGMTPTDDTAILALAGMDCAVLPNQHCNQKITLPEDLDLVANMLKKSQLPQ